MSTWSRAALGLALAAAPQAYAGACCVGSTTTVPTRLGECEHVFVLAMHHIVSDGWSMQIIMAELQGTLVNIKLIRIIYTHMMISIELLNTHLAKGQWYSGTYFHKE